MICTIFYIAIYVQFTSYEPQTTNHEPRTTITSTIKVQTHSSLHPLVKCGIYFACSVQNSIHGHIDSVNANRRFDTSRSTKKEVPNYRSDMLFDVPELSGGWMGCWLVNGGWWMSELLTYITWVLTERWIRTCKLDTSTAHFFTSTDTT